MIGKDQGTLSFTAGGVRGIKYRESRTRSGPHDFAVHLQRNTWNGREKAEFMGEALRSPQALSLAGEPGDGPTLERLDPKRPCTASARARRPTQRARWPGIFERHLPGLTLLGGDADLSGEVVLYALPPDDTLARWLGAGPGVVRLGTRKRWPSWTVRRWAAAPC